MVLVVGFAWGYDEIRELHGNVVAAGVQHGTQLLRLDHLLHLDWTSTLNRWLVGEHALGAVLSGYYVVMHLGMTALVLLVLWVHGPTYRRQRNALIVLSLIGLVVYWLYPVAPPRLLPGFHDTVRQHIPAAYSVEAAKANLYAAFPSLHMAWALWCGIALWLLSARRWVRVVAVAHPVVTAFTVLATGNHYVIDLFAGVAIVGIGYGAIAIAVVVR
ncbi:MAG TPA: phosphatase PAP2 family protein, partial [Mycobacteriales bacterium]|nr:phosphatase PAP2 family protein [Mycobacteriales bacterium]